MRLVRSTCMSHTSLRGSKERWYCGGSSGGGWGEGSCLVFFFVTAAAAAPVAAVLEELITEVQILLSSNLKLLLHLLSGFDHQVLYHNHVCNVYNLWECL